MFINQAFAQPVDLDTQETVGVDMPNTAPPSQTEAIAWNMGMVVVLVALFYLLMIRPQQQRFKEHSQMLSQLKKGDKVSVSGGLVGKIDSIKEGEDEVKVDLGGGSKVTVLRSALLSLEEKKS